jgi:hypothetical protein
MIIHLQAFMKEDSSVVPVFTNSSGLNVSNMTSSLKKSGGWLVPHGLQQDSITHSHSLPSLVSFDPPPFRTSSALDNHGGGDGDGDDVMSSFEPSGRIIRERSRSSYQLGEVVPGRARSFKKARAVSRTVPTHLSETVGPFHPKELVQFAPYLSKSPFDDRFHQVTTSGTFFFFLSFSCHSKTNKTKQNKTHHNDDINHINDILVLV